MCCVSVHVQHKRLSLSQFYVCAAGRSKRKSFWNDGKKALLKSSRSIPLGQDLYNSRGILCAVPHTGQTTGFPPNEHSWYSTSGHVGAPSLLASSPSNPSLHKQTSLLVPPTVIVTIPCTSFYRLSKPRYSVMTAVGYWYCQRLLLIHFFCDFHIYSLTFWCVLGCHFNCYYFVYI